MESAAPPTTTNSAVRQPRRQWILLAAGVLVALGISYAAYMLANYSWAQVVDYKSPFTTMLRDTAPVGADAPIPGATPRRVVLVLIDGMTDSASRTMASINALRAKGSDVALTVPQPSLSFPTWTTILTGAPPSVSGVTTNWYERRVEVESLFDSAANAGRTVVVSGSSDLDMLYGVSKVAKATSFTEWKEGTYTTGKIVDNALSLAKANDADFVFALFPDVDEAGHANGASSEEYAAVVAKVDADLTRLIAGLDDGNTVFVVLPDHGHIATGGHGGWEDPVIHTSATFAGPGVRVGTAAAKLQDVAPTISVIAGFPAPRYAAGVACAGVLADPNGSAQQADLARAAAFTSAYIRTLGQPAPDAAALMTPAALASATSDAEAARLASDRGDRLPMALGLALAALALLVAIGAASWRALVGALAGSATYFAVYNALFFLVHHYAWSLSAFNEETKIQAFFNGRMIEAVIAGLIGCMVAGDVYLILRPEPKGVRAGFTSGWLSLGVATALSIQALLGLQVAWFLWQWGATTVWRLPDLLWGFKYDLDLIQGTAIAGVAILGPALTYLIGRFHPRVVRR